MAKSKQNNTINFTIGVKSTSLLATPQSFETRTQLNQIADYFSASNQAVLLVFDMLAFPPFLGKLTMGRAC